MDRACSRRACLRALGTLVGAGSVGGLAAGSAGTRSDGHRQTATETWAEFGYDAANTGYAPQNRGPVAEIETEWVYEMGERVASSPVVADGIVVFGTTGGTITALSTADGTEEWTYETNTESIAPAVVVEDTVYVGADELYALSLSDGSVRWSRRRSPSPDSAPTAADGAIYDVDDAVVAYASSDGSERRVFGEGLLFNTFAVTDEAVYAAGPGDVPDRRDASDHSLFAFSRSDGTRLWRYEMDDEVHSTPAAHDDTVYVGNDDGKLYAVATADGTERWTDIVGRVVTSPAVAGETVYVASNTGTLVALSTADGGERWRRDLGDRLSSSPAVVSDTVYVGSADPTVYALATSDGRDRWSFGTEDTAYPSPAVANGTVYAGSRHAIYALTGEVPEPTPTPTPEPTPTRTPTPTPPADDDTPTRTPTETARPTETTPEPGPTPTPSGQATTADPSGGSGPGFGVLGTLAALGIGGWWARESSREDE